METFDFQAILSVYYCRNYAEAAHQLSITPSAISKIIARAEEELGVSLFERAARNRPVELTEAGRVLIPHIQKAMAGILDVQEQAAWLRENTTYHLRIGYSPSIGHYGEGKLISPFILNNPHVQVQLCPGQSEELVSRLYAGSLDCLLLTVSEWDLEDKDGLSSQLYSPAVCANVIRSSEALMLAANRESTIGKQKEVTIKDVPGLAGKTILLNSRSNYIKYLDRIKKQYHLDEIEDIHFRFIDFDRPGTIYTMLVDYPDVVAPYIGLKQKRKREWASVPVTDWQVKTYLYFVYLNTHHSKALRLFQDAVRDFVDTVNGSGYNINTD